MEYGALHPCRGAYQQTLETKGDELVWEDRRSTTAAKRKTYAIIKNFGQYEHVENSVCMKKALHVPS